LFLGLKDQVLKLVRKYPEANFFLDEVPLDEFRIKLEDLKEIAEAINEESFFWFACQSQLSPSQQYLEECGNTFYQTPLLYLG
jgi:hypothetical protein